MMKIICKGFLLLFVFVSTFSRLTAQTASPETYDLSADKLEEAARRMQEFVDKGAYPYIANMILVDGNVVVKQTFGYNDPDKQEPLREDAIYRIFSMSKPITAAALMILYDEGLFHLDDPVYEYIPAFKNTQVYTPEGLVPQEHPMTITNLLTHTSGLTYGWDQNSPVDSIYGANREKIGGSIPLAEVVKNLASLPLKYQPGTHYEYSLSLDVAGYLVEVLSGMSFDQFLSERMFVPLKMKDTGFYVPEEKKDRLVRLYTRRKKGPLQTSDNTNGVRFFKKPVYFSGGGGLVSTMDDYARFTTMLLNGGELDGVRILKKKTVDLIISNHLPAGVKGWDGYYGLGGSVDAKTGEYGWGGAASTAFAIIPEHNMTVMSFTQLMPAKFTYAEAYLELVKEAIIE